MSPRSEKQLEEIRKSRRIQIMEAALESFGIEGYFKASISSIAKRANISKGLLYNYFKSKEDLLDAILSYGIQKFTGILASLDGASETLETPDDLRNYIQGGFEVIRREPDFYKLYFGIFLQPGVSVIARTRYTEFVSTMLGKVVDYYGARGVSDPFSKALLLGALMDGIGLYYLMSPGDVSLDKLENMIFELFR
jgi:AcrR family transcriptional regulator